MNATLNQTYTAKQTAIRMTVAHIRRNGDLEMEFFSPIAKRVIETLVPAEKFASHFE